MHWSRQHAAAAERTRLARARARVQARAHARARARTRARPRTSNTVHTSPRRLVRLGYLAQQKIANLTTY